MANAFIHIDPIEYRQRLFEVGRAELAKPIEGEVLEIVRNPRNPDGTAAPTTERSETKGAPR